MDIIKASDIRDKLIQYSKSGGPNRFYLGFEPIDKHYGIREASRTDWTGYPGSGKTELMLECLWNCSNYYDHKHLIHMPDAGSITEITAKLFKKITGKSLERFYWDNNGLQESNSVATVQEIDRYLPEILHYFKIFNTDKSVTPRQFWKYAEDNQSELGIFSAVIDSWNYMAQDLDGLREDKWLAENLQYANDVVERSGMHFHTVIHPKSTRLVNGKLQPPSYHEMKGGSEWGNYGKSVIVVHREKGSAGTEIHFDKIKGANIGIKGMQILHYDIQRGKYFVSEVVANNFLRHYASPKGEKTGTELIQSAVVSSNDFYNPKEKDDEFPF